MTRKQRPSRRDVLKGGAALLVAGLSGGRAQAEEAQTPAPRQTQVANSEHQNSQGPYFVQKEP